MDKKSNEQIDAIKKVAAKEIERYISQYIPKEFDDPKLRRIIEGAFAWGAGWAMANTTTKDEKRLDFLQELTGKDGHSGKVFFREPDKYNPWCLCEVLFMEDSVSDSVREAIDKVMKEY